MAYCTKDDIINDLTLSRLIELTDDAGQSVGSNFTTAMTAVVTNAIANADAIINDYCRGRYTVPFTTVPQTIKSASVQLAIYNLHTRIKKLDMDDMRRVIYEDTIDYLRRVSRGEVVLDVTPEPTAEDVTAITSNKTSASRIFTSTELSTY